ncbi:MAG TPA: hypothetical protein DEH78_12015 [Solibacterales bacterium]|nr:hypothetical protein [Bryobacterales bacterium]
MTFAVRRFRLHFAVRGRVEFPPWRAGNVLRGALGTVWREETFRPALEGGPSGLADPPRPFVLRAAHLNGRTAEGGFWFDLNLFTGGVPDDVGRLKRLRGTPVTLLRIEDLGGAAFRLDEPWADRGEGALEFYTPVRLKGAEDDARPAFATLFARLRDRISTLRALYGEGPLEIDFRALAERASAVTLEAANLQFVTVERRSSRTGQTHSLGGWVGEVRYRGDLGEFWPYLLAGEYTGVGRQTVWGNGAYRLS